ncbi:MAG: PfkB family carbohydrate kinase [Chloroflexota bacterium]
MSGVSFVSIGNIIIDDIVLPDGVTHMGVLGGGGTHAIAGMRIWTDQVGFVAAIGPDFPEPCRKDLGAYNIDLSGVLVRPGYQTARAWQIFEWDERRIEIFRTDFDAFIKATPLLEEMPESYWHARGVHLLSDSRKGPVEVTSILKRRADSVVLWEPPPLIVTPEGRGMAQEVLPYIDVFSPNLREAAALCETDDVTAILHTLFDWGAEIVALRMGVQGSLVQRQGGPVMRVPVVPTDIVDVTGAGNAYCGGFVVGLVETGDLAVAAMYGAVSASFALEQFGIPCITPETQQEAQRRLVALKRRVESRTMVLVPGI